LAQGGGGNARMPEEERQLYENERRREKEVSRQKRDVSFEATHAAASGVRHLHYAVLHNSFISYAQDRTPLSIPPSSGTSQSISRSMSTLEDRPSPRSYPNLSGSVVPKISTHPWLLSKKSKSETSGGQPTLSATPCSDSRTTAPRCPRTKMWAGCRGFRTVGSQICRRTRRGRGPEPHCGDYGRGHRAGRRGCAGAGRANSRRVAQARDS
jgi:hypothetical protein